MKSHEIYFFEPVELEIRDFPVTGHILDIGGGGEGIIGRLKGKNVVSIDRREDELLEAPRGPLKVVMDAGQLGFPDSTFSVATAFFSFMYFEKTGDIKAALAEIFRVLRPGGVLHLWDINITKRPDTEKEIFAVRLKCFVKGQVCETAYGRPWLKENRDSAFCRRLAEARGFRHIQTRKTKRVFHSSFRKPEKP